MTYEKAIEVLTRYQEWRICGDGDMLNPTIITEALNTIINSYGKLRAEVFESSDQWWFRIKSNNHEIVAPSEGYKSKTGAIKTAKLFNIPIAIK
jgi:hypothetical protein